MARECRHCPPSLHPLRGAGGFFRNAREEMLVDAKRLAVEGLQPPIVALRPQQARPRHAPADVGCGRPVGWWWMRGWWVAGG